jgi:ankyrin repeat protein
MWLVDTKGRMPLFMASFMGKVDCVGFLIELAISEGCEFNLSVADQQGDTALHAACLKGYMQCASLLLFHTSCTRNNAKLLPQQLADKAGHPELGKYVTSVHTQKKSGVSSEEIFGCDFAAFSAVVLFYRSRWTKVGHNNNCCPHYSYSLYYALFTIGV